MNGQLESRLDVLSGTNLFPPGLLQRLGTWLATAPEKEVYRINAVGWAKQNQASEDLVIDMFLHATRAGLVDMVWSVLCTQCGMLVTSPGGLRAMSRGKRHCRL